MVMSRIIIVHGWGAVSAEEWFPWLKNELENKGFDVLAPNMPNSEAPKIEEWISHLQKICPNLNNDTYFIGHSIGCQAILRHLEKMDAKVGGVVFVAGWFDLTGLETEEEKEIAKPWVETPIDFEKLKNLIPKSVAIFSDNDPYVEFEKNSQIFKEKLNSEVIIETSKGHFSGEDGIVELPEVVEAISGLQRADYDLE